MSFRAPLTRDVGCSTICLSNSPSLYKGQVRRKPADENTRYVFLFWQPTDIHAVGDCVLVIACWYYIYIIFFPTGLQNGYSLLVSDHCNKQSHFFVFFRHSSVLPRMHPQQPPTLSSACGLLGLRSSQRLATTPSNAQAAPAVHV